MPREIVTTTARLDDEAEMAKFLLPIPNGEQLGKVLEDRRPVSTRAYDDETQSARFVESDGDIVKCFMVADITIDQAELITAEWEGICTLDESEFHRAIERALQDSIDRAK